MHTREQ
ncbi:hypothetical protein D039_2764A, partial [Vibrio parahaemolyticus EKP-028]